MTTQIKTILSNNLKSQKGAMDRILVTLLLIVVAITALVAIETWFGDHKENIKSETSSSITSVINGSN